MHVLVFCTVPSSLPEGHVQHQAHGFCVNAFQWSSLPRALLLPSSHLALFSLPIHQWFDEQRYSAQVRQASGMCFILLHTREA